MNGQPEPLLLAFVKEAAALGALVTFAAAVMAWAGIIQGAIA